jgi:hypothetical protein
MSKPSGRPMPECRHRWIVSSKDLLMRTFACVAASLFSVAMPIAALAANSYSKGASAVADAWLGHDASELLMQWPVDRGFTQEELPGGETAYSYGFGTPEEHWTESVTNAVGQVGNTMIMETQAVPHYKAAEHHCTVTFYANKEGIISRYEYDGVKCQPYMKSWGRPKGT